MVRIFDGRLTVSYGQAYVKSSESNGTDLEDNFLGQTNGLCGAALPGTLCLLTGLHTGDVSITLDVLNSPPPIDDIWEEIVDVSFTPSSERVILSELDGTFVCDIPLVHGSYRVRYCVRNMERGSEVDTYAEGEPVDFYSLSFWLADSAPDVIVKQTTQVAAYWHNWAQALRL